MRQLAPVRDAFVDGAHFLYGHTALARHADLGYAGAWADEHLPTRSVRNAFYCTVGRRLPPGAPGIELAKHLSPDMTPDAILQAL